MSSSWIPLSLAGESRSGTRNHRAGPSSKLFFDYDTDQARDSHPNSESGEKRRTWGVNAVPTFSVTGYLRACPLLETRCPCCSDIPARPLKEGYSTLSVPGTFVVRLWKQAREKLLCCFEA
jgi:hypothetical protein